MEDQPFQMGEVISLLAYGLSKAPDKVPDLIWSADKQSFDYHGERFYIPMFKVLIQSILEEGIQLVADMSFVAYRDPFSTIPDSELLQRLKENARDPTAYYSFLTDSRNQWIEGLEHYVLYTIQQTPKLRDKFFASLPVEITYRLEAISHYVGQANRLLEGKDSLFRTSAYIFLLTYICSNSSINPYYGRAACSWPRDRFPPCLE